MHTIKIFLVSPAELQNDRREFEIFINRENKILHTKGIFLHLDIWEDAVNVALKSRLQDEVNKNIAAADIFVMLFFTRVGTPMEKEFDTALSYFKENKKPVIHAYFKNAPIEIVSVNEDNMQTLWSFQKRLKGLGYFQTVYTDAAALTIHFKNKLYGQITAFLPEEPFPTFSQKQVHLNDASRSEEDKPWACVNDATHLFSPEEAKDHSYFCPICPPYEGMLIQKTFVPDAVAASEPLFGSPPSTFRGDNEIPGPPTSSPYYSPAYESSGDSNLSAGYFDFVKCTVFAPPKTAPGKTIMVQVFAHISGEEAAIMDLATTVDETAKLRASRQLDYEIKKGMELTFSLSMQGVKIDEPVQKLFWRGRAESIQYGIYIPENHAFDSVIGTIYVTQDTVPFGHVKFIVSVEDPNTHSRQENKEPAINDTWKRYRHAFISYASADRPEVLKRVQMLPRAGISYFQDLLALEPGERWEKSLYKHIDRADVFFLFWSKAAKDSRWVMEEVHYAMERGGSGNPEIVPVIIEGPPPVPPPPELKHIHFNDPFIYFINAPVEAIKTPREEVSLCVVLLDASSSMTEPAFNGTPLTRMALVAKSVASGIFDMERVQHTSNAYIACFKFDDRVELLFTDTVANIIKLFKTPESFAVYLYDEMFKFQQGTDLNKALREAYSFVDRFLKNELDTFPLKNYAPALQRILMFNSVDAVSVPNVRVLLCTDGGQYDTDGNTLLNPNPFKPDIANEINHDILIGAYLGTGTDEGCSDLKNLVSNCPIHNTPQFFLFDDPASFTNLKYLFRMAAGAAGFCPRCLEKNHPH